MKIKSPSERGQAIILIVLSIVGLLALTALAVDGGNVYSERRRAQNAADTTALDATLAKVRGQNLFTEGLARAASNKYVDSDPTAASSTPGVNVEIYNPPINGPYSGQSQYVQAIITADVNTYFGRVIGISKVTNKVEAVARAKPEVIGVPFNGLAIVALSLTECNAIMYQGTSNTKVTGGGLFSNSNCPDAAFFNNSASARLTAPCLQTVGGITYAPSAINIPSDCIQSGLSPLPTPKYPNPTCDGPATQYANFLSPGSVAGNFPPTGVTVLNPGVYCVGGNFQLNATDSLKGDGVVIRVETGFLRWNGSAHIELRAPTEGPFEGLLVFLPEGNISPVEINGDSGSIMEGSIMAPSAPVTINGTGAVGLEGQVIGDTVKLSGTSAIEINYTGKPGEPTSEQPAVELVQ